MAFGTVSGTFQGTNASIPASFASALSTGSGAVNVGDIVVCLVIEQTALTVTSVTDSQANTYTAQNAGTLSGANVSGRLFWTRITTAGTLTSVTATCTASADDGVIIAAIIQGPFLASPVDVNLANAPDLSSPFTAPASGTMAQTTEVVVSWCASTGSAAFTGTSPTIIAIQKASAAVVEGVIGTQVPPSTATVTPTYTGTAPTANELGTISFKGDIAELDAAYSQPLSEPSVKTKIAPQLAVTLMVSGLFAPPVRPILPTDTKWFSPFSDPVRRIPAAQKVNLFPFTAKKLVNHIGWFSPLSEPARNLKFNASLQDVSAETYLPPAAPITTNWLASLSEPVRIKVSPATQQATAFVPVVAQAVQVSIDWFTSFSEPVRVRTSPANQQVLALDPNPIVATGWSVPLSEPAKAKQRAIADYAYAPLAVSEVVTIDKWFNPLADPARKPGPITSPADFTPLFTENSIALNTRFSSLIEPTRARARPTESPALFFVATTAAETVTVDKWFSPFPDQLRKAGLGTGSQQTLALVEASPFAETVTESRWHQPWSEPVRQRTGLSATNQQALAFVATVVVAAPAESWFAPLTDPVRRIPAAQKVNLFPFTAAAVVTTETVTVDKWFVSFTDPVRVKPQLATGLQQSLALVEAAPFPETVTETRWHQPWSEPLRSKPGLLAANQAAFFAPSAVITSEVVTVDKWFAPFQNPSKPKTSVSVASQPALTISTNPIVSFGWVGSLSDPPRVKAALATANQVAFFAPSQVITTEIVTVDKWFQQLADPTRRKPEDRDRYSGENDWTAVAVSMEWFAPLNEPVRQKIGLSVTQQRALAFVVTIASTEVVTVDKWFVSFQDPVRVKPALLTGRQQFLTWPTQIIIPSLASWWRPLAEPPKAKAGLLTANQRFATQAADFIPHPNQFLEGWFNWFSEPVRKLAQLNTALQKAWFGPDRNAVQATVTATMAVTEVNGDVALFAIKVFAGNPPATAVVSLVEIGHGASLTSIVEEGDDGSGTSVVES